MDLNTIWTLNNWHVASMPTTDANCLAVDCSGRITQAEGTAFAHASPSLVNCAPALFALMSPCSFLAAIYSCHL